MNKKKQILKFIIFDSLAALISWILFFNFRKLEEGVPFSNLSHVTLSDPKFLWGLFIYPFFWLLLHYMWGEYRQIYRKSRAKELEQTFFQSILGCLILFFSIILDDQIDTYKEFYLYLGVLFLSYLPLVSVFRISIISKTIKQIEAKKIGFNTLIIGDNDKAKSTIQILENAKHSSGNKFIGYVSIHNSKPDFNLTHLGSYHDLKDIIIKNKIEEIIISLDPADTSLLPQILSEIQTESILIKMTPNLDNILSGAVKTTSIFGEPFIVLNFKSMPIWQKIIKRGFEIFFCSLGLLVLSPLLLLAILKIKRSSPGPIFYTQKRVGRREKEFTIYKFRSMYVDAEGQTPLLSSDHDTRTTPWGKIMRKYRIDELPQFLNVLKGDMALVGPRPERSFFVKQIVQKAPQYKLLFNIKPGITSWGEIKYGYAENVDEMIARMEFDLIYLENISLLTDFKILLHTICVVFRGEGK